MNRNLHAWQTWLTIFSIHVYVCVSLRFEMYLNNSYSSFTTRTKKCTITQSVADHLVYYRRNNLEIYRGHLYNTCCAVREYLHSRAYILEARAYKRILYHLFFAFLNWNKFPCMMFFNWYFIMTTKKCL